MTEYAEGSFNVSEYLSKRPQYPEKIYDLIIDYHKHGNTQTLLDLGCGPGQGSWPFLGIFDNVIGVDPGEGMIKHARQAYEQIAKDRICAVESLDSLKVPERSVDLAIAATAAHWFDMQRTYAHLSKLVKSGGTVAFWTYDLAYPKYHSSTAEMVSRFAYEDMAQYVDLQGCKRIQSLYKELDQPPANEWEDVRHFAYPNFGVNKNYIPVLEKELPAHLSSVEGTEWDWDLHTDVS
ncbi:S-adenosyl-L-methionine-dependent methyltransferase [Meira miltonrushii]|uniref:S-adenosyl-L-methionine-dependent methyltransferase n=1 Tax=Meira miltonrushii TaxID=1280837 RepID=A0A316V6S0_9BASI|nr:S-adenosyl-L-methionine-dependent methyltransferase [Meira miltonrushii]PWN33230.1 S-adenosyl-L-methionine-dependent methyltransferase [Meira miltonrushii]